MSWPLPRNEGLFVNLLDPALASYGLLCGKTSAPSKSHAENKPGGAKFKSAETDAYGPIPVRRRLRSEGARMTQSRRTIAKPRINCDVQSVR